MWLFISMQYINFDCDGAVAIEYMHSSIHMHVNISRVNIKIVDVLPMERHPAIHITATVLESVVKKDHSEVIIRYLS